MSSSLKDKTTELRRAHILAAAINVFAERGYHRATIRDVARESGISDGTIYNYFENKAALLMAALDPMDEIEASREKAIPAALPDIRALLTEQLRNRFEALTPEKLDLHRVVLSEALINPEVRSLYMERMLAPTFTLPEAAFEMAAASGAIRSNDVPFTLRAITAAVLGLAMLRLLGDEITTKTWDAISDRLASLLLDGLAPAAEVGGAHGPV